MLKAPKTAEDLFEAEEFIETDPKLRREMKKAAAAHIAERAAAKKKKTD